MPRRKKFDDVAFWSRPAHPLRGKGYEDAAEAFLKAFPIGRRLTSEEFGDWAQSEGLISGPSSNQKQSDGWQAYCQRRHQLRHNINKAGTHPRMSSPFVIDSLGIGSWEVRSPSVAIIRSQMLDKIHSLTMTKRRQLKYLIESADWEALPPEDRLVAESLTEDIDQFEERVDLDARSIARKFSRLEQKLKAAVASGLLKPRNGAIRAIIDGRDPSDDRRDDDAASGVRIAH